MTSENGSTQSLLRRTGIPADCSDSKNLTQVHTHTVGHIARETELANYPLHPMTLTDDTQTDTRSMASFRGEPGSAGTRKAKPFCILMTQEMTEWQWHQLDHIQIICTLLQADNHARTSSLNFLQAGCSS